MGSTAYEDAVDVIALPNRNRRRRTRIALLIRCACVLVFTLFCFIAPQRNTPQHNEVDNVKLFARGHPQHYTEQRSTSERTGSIGGLRKLLAIQEQLVVGPQQQQQGQQQQQQQQIDTSTTPTPTTTQTPQTDTLSNGSSNSTTDVPAQDATEAIVAASANANCTKAAIHEFPPDGFTRAQRQRGWFMLHIALSCYCFWLLAIVCDDYFVPAMESMCSKLNMKEDVVGATFMAAATSSPELFINCIGTFVTQGDLGVGTVVGAAVFNILAVPACCGLFARQVVHLDWWPVSRDCLMYGVAVVSLIGVLYDGIVMWYEGLALVLGYIFYIIAMYCNDSISNKVRIIVARLRQKARRVRPFREVTEIVPLLQEKRMGNGIGGANGQANYNGVENNNSNGQTFNSGQGQHHIGLETIVEDGVHSSCRIGDLDDDQFLADSPWRRSTASSWWGFVLRWPITTALWATIPDCRRRPQLRILTFMMCIVWIGMTSYLVAYLITIVGDTINIPDSVMGLTFLAAGTSVPEAVSSVIVTNQGHGAMGISNSIGSNTFDILLCLGLPWFVKAYFLPAVPGEHWITINSAGISYSAVSLLTTLAGLYAAFLLNKFRLDWKIGLTCTLMYAAYLLFASLVELNVFFPVNLPTCSH